MTQKQLKAEKVEALFWKLVGQAMTAFPKECDAILDKHLARVSTPDLPISDWFGNPIRHRALADAVEEIAQKFPKQAFTHM